MNQITFKQYRNIDITILVVIAVVFEAIATMAASKWFNQQPVALSITLAVTLIVMMRWSGFAAIVAAAGGITYCVVLDGATLEQYLIYGIGNMAALLALAVIRLFGKEAVRSSTTKLLLFGASGYAGMALGRWIVSLFFGADISSITVYLTTDIMSLLFAVIILMLLRKTEGMLEDQKAYLLRLDREKREKANSTEPEDDFPD